MPSIFLPLKETKKLAELTQYNELSADYIYFPAIPVDPVENISREQETVKIISVKNEFNEEILDSMNKNVLSLLLEICKKDVDHFSRSK